MSADTTARPLLAVLPLRNREIHLLSEESPSELDPMRLLKKASMDQPQRRKKTLKRPIPVIEECSPLARTMPNTAAQAVMSKTTSSNWNRHQWGSSMMSSLKNKHNTLQQLRNNQRCYYLTHSNYNSKLRRPQEVRVDQLQTLDGSYKQWFENTYRKDINDVMEQRVLAEQSKWARRTVSNIEYQINMLNKMDNPKSSFKQEMKKCYNQIR